jgi:hypothetical protein
MADARAVVAIPETELPPPQERELRAQWFSSLSDAEREQMAHRPFWWIEATYSTWCALHGSFPPA